MASRTTFSELSSPPVSGPDLLEEYSDRLKTLFDASALPLTSVGGTADAVTATLDPALDGGGLVDGMKFEITWGATNTGGVTLALNGGSAVSVLDPAGTALAAGAIGSGLRSLLEYIGGAFRVLSPLLTSLGGGSQRYFWQFTASGTWNRPVGLDDDTMVLIEAWGGGGSGSSTSGGPGGGGGGYSLMRIRVGDLASSVSVTIGAGGAVGSDGGNTSFGAILTAYGGARGNGNNGGGGGGGSHQSGSISSSTAGGAGGRVGGGIGGTSQTAGSPAAAGDSYFGGGGGGGAGLSSGVYTNGAWSVFGGGGGGSGATGSNGGVSIFGGNGGGNGIAGTAPGGGGGRNAAGARGEVRVWI